MFMVHQAEGTTILSLSGVSEPKHLAALLLPARGQLEEEELEDWHYLSPTALCGSLDIGDDLFWVENRVKPFLFNEAESWRC